MLIHAPATTQILNQGVVMTLKHPLLGKPTLNKNKRIKLGIKQHDIIIKSETQDT